MEFNLTVGAIKCLSEGKTVETPILQILAFKKVKGTHVDRIKLILSDGVHLNPLCILNGPLSELVIDNMLEKLTIVRLDSYSFCKVRPDRRLLVIQELTEVVEGSVVREILGDPTVLPSNNTATTSPQTQQAMPSTSSVVRHVPTSSSQVLTLCSIERLEPYDTNWKIQGEVTTKSSVIYWDNAKGKGQFFSMTLWDNSREIRATAFKEQCDAFYEMIEVGKVYFVSRAQVRRVKNRASAAEYYYELIFNRNTVVEPCNDDVTFHQIPLNQVSLDQLRNVSKGVVLDVLGICKTVGDVETIVSRETLKELQRRFIELVDDSKTKITVTLWGTLAETFAVTGYPVIGLRNVKSSDFGGCSISTRNNTEIRINPDMEKAHKLRRWFDEEGIYCEMNHLSNIGRTTPIDCDWRSFHNIQAVFEDEPYLTLNYTIKATITSLKKEHCVYKACPSEMCNKKLMDLNNGSYQCDKCQKEYQSFKWRLLLNINLCDHTGEIWVTCFHDMAELILKKKAAELGELKVENIHQFYAFLDELNFKSFVFRLQSKMEIYKEESQLKTSVISVAPVKIQNYGLKLLLDFEDLTLEPVDLG